MAVQTITSPLSIASNKIVAIGRRSGNSLPTVTREFNDFLTFLDIKANEIDAIALPNPRKIQELSSINVTNTLGNTGGLLSSLLSGGLDLAGLVTGKETKKGGGKLKGKPSPKMSGNKLKLGGIRGIGVINSIFAGLDFATGLAEGESVGKAAAGAGGSLAGSLLGGAIGQTLIPVPGLGFVIGSSIGGFLGGYTADRVVDTVESKGKGNQQSSLRKELDVKIREQSRQQASMVGSKSEKSFKQSVNNFSKAVDKFGEFFGVSSLIPPQSFTEDTQDETYDDVDELQNNNSQKGELADMQVEGGVLPSSVKITSEYGPRRRGYHYGTDYGSGQGTLLSLIQPGTVVFAGLDSKGNGSVYIDHPDGSHTRYLHLSVISVKTGQQIIPGTVIGKTGGDPGTYGAGSSTGPHLHFEYSPPGGKTSIKSDPYADKYFRFGGNVKVRPKVGTPSTTSSSKVFNLEIHSVGPNESQRSGLIRSAIDPENTASRTLMDNYGVYPMGFRDLGGPKRGLHLLETDMKLGVESNAQRLFNTLRNLQEYKFNLFAGHNDVTIGSTGTEGEREYTRKVAERVIQLAKENKVGNIMYYPSVIANDPNDLNANWNRARVLREKPLKNMQVSQPSKIRPKLFEPTSSTDRSSGIRQYTSYNKPSRAPSVAVIDRNVNNIVMVGGGNNSSAPTVIAPPSNDGGMVVSYGPTPNQLRDSVAEFILLSSIG